MAGPRAPVPEMDSDNIVQTLFFSRREQKWSYKNPNTLYISSSFKKRGTQKRAGPTGCQVSALNVSILRYRKKKQSLCTELKENRS